MGADGKKEGLEALGAQGVKVDVRTEPGVKAKIHTQLLYFGNLAVNDVGWQTIAWDADQNHASRPGQCLNDPDTMSMQGQIVGGAQSPRAGTDDAYLAACRGRLAGVVVAAPGHGPFSGKGLEKFDRHRGIDPCPDAHELTGTGAYQAAHPGQGVVAANDLYGFVVMAKGDERQIGRDIYSRRTGHLAWCRGEVIADRRGTVAIVGMAAEDLAMFDQASLQPRPEFDSRGITGKGAQLLDPGVDTRQVFGSCPGGNYILDQGGYFLYEATTSRMDDPPLGRDLS